MWRSVFSRRRIGFILEWKGRLDKDGNPITKTGDLGRLERFEFAEPADFDDRLVGWWPDVSAPRDYLVNRRGSICHVRQSKPSEDTGEVVPEVETQLRDGDEFEVLTSEDRTIRIGYKENAAASGSGEKAQDDSVASQEGDSVI